jgi:hypothetical protein
MPQLGMLMQAIWNGLKEKDILIAMHDPDAAAVFADLRWDGAIQPDTADFLMVVDANVGYNKANAHITQRLTYTVDLSDLATPSGLLNVQHTHTLPGSDQCEPTTFIRGDDYADMTAACYWNYLRVLAPQGSQFFAANIPPVRDEWLFIQTDEARQVSVYDDLADVLQFGVLLVVPMGTAQEASLYYRLPEQVVAREDDRWHYSLAIQKQPGREPIPLQVRLRLPPNATLFESSPVPVSQTDQTLVLDMVLVHDQTVSVTFGLPE